MRSISKILDDFEALIVELRNSLGEENLNVDTLPKLKKLPSVKKYNGITGKIQELISEGFFDQPKELNKIREKLKADGFNKPSTSLMAPLMRLIKAKILGRDKTLKGNYQYNKK